MKKINNNQLNEATEEMFTGLKLDNQEKTQKRRKVFIEENKQKWFENGQRLKVRRVELGLSLRLVASLLKTSPSRIRSHELGNPILMAESLTASCHLLYDHIELKKSFRSFYDDHNLRRRF